jgi:hypothetical protein
MNGPSVDESVGQLGVPARQWSLLLDRFDHTLPSCSQPKEA